MCHWFRIELPETVKMLLFKKMLVTLFKSVAFEMFKATLHQRECSTFLLMSPVPFFRFHLARGDIMYVEKRQLTALCIVSQ
jgi:hypothetical protein